MIKNITAYRVFYKSGLAPKIRKGFYLYVNLKYCCNYRRRKLTYPFFPYLCLYKIENR